MTTQISLISLFTNASLIVQFVMLLLLGASLASWYAIFERQRLLGRLLQSTEQFEKNFWSGIDVGKLYNKLSVQKQLNGLEQIFVAGFKEFLRLKKLNNLGVEQLMQGTERAMGVSIVREVEKLEHRLSFLATVQSSSPYVGLFGTVWGIMHAFKQLGSVQQATLAMVAPGISEALVATAMGLIAAIPAGIAYNRFNKTVGTLENRYQLFIDEFVGLLQRRTQQASEEGTQS